MIYDYKEIKLVDTALMSGSSDSLRTALGETWEIVSSSLGEYLEFSENMTEVSEVEGIYSYSPTDSDAYIAEIKTNTNFKLTGSSEVYVPNFYMPIRIVGNPSRLDSDEAWSAYVKGGEYLTSSFDGIYTNNVFTDFYYERKNPYSTLEENIIGASGESMSQVDIEITSKMNMYLPEYQNLITDYRETQIPNLYMYTSIILENIESEDLPPDLADYITLQGYLSSEEAWALTKRQSSDVLPPAQTTGFKTKYAEASTGERQSTSEQLYDNSYNFRFYLTSSMILHPHSASVLTSIGASMQNVFFDAPVIEYTLSPDSAMVSRVKDQFPFYISIDIPTRQEDNPGGEDFMESPAFINNIIQLNEASLLALKLIKESFSGSMGMSTESFNEMSTYISASLIYGAHEQTDTIGKSFKTDNLISMLSTNYETLYTDNFENDSIIIDFLNDGYRFSSYEYPSSYRFIDTEKTLSILGSLCAAGSPSKLNPTGDMDDDAYFGFESLLDLYKLGNTNKYNETIAYRIEKRYANTTIQNIWIYDDNSHESLVYFDTQVKYGEEYEYVVYAYDIVVGAKYKYDDLVVSRKISTTDTGAHCLEFYDPFSGRVSEQLFSDENITNNNMEPYVIPASTEALYAYGDAGYPYGADMDGYGIWALENETAEYTYPSTHPTMAGETVTLELVAWKAVGTTFGTNAQVASENQFLADFNLYYEPEVKIIEVPLTRKTLSVLDNAPNKVEVAPFQMIDDSQRIGFKVSLETFDKQHMPHPLSNEQEAYAIDYRVAQNWPSEAEYIKEQSKSAVSQFEVFRIDTEPQSYDDFKGSLYKTYDLSIDNTNLYDSMIYCISTIQTNKKYYYSFRSVNQLGIPGNLSEIYQCELINDGGYKYARFNVINDTDLAKPPEPSPSKELKKLLLIKPSVQNTLFTTTDGLDYSDNGHNQLDNITIGAAEDPIWDKKFKFRFTSKKTGKKIDFNITYRLREG
tara:strand:- start:3870 stop:6794 length:2925 start_codon:yes stop_codon:yes gene_type:complete